MLVHLSLQLLPYATVCPSWHPAGAYSRRYLCKTRLMVKMSILSWFDEHGVPIYFARTKRRNHSGSSGINIIQSSKEFCWLWESVSWHLLIALRKKFIMKQRVWFLQPCTTKIFSPKKKVRQYYDETRRCFGRQIHCRNLSELQQSKCLWRPMWKVRKSLSPGDLINPHSQLSGKTAGSKKNQTLVFAFG